MLGAQAAIYACGLFWLPFGMAIAKGVSPAAICPDAQGASKCLYNIFNWGMVPFLPGEAFKMALLLVTVPGAWALLLALYRWRTGMAPVPEAGEAEAEGAEEEEEEVEREAAAAAAQRAADPPQLRRGEGTGCGAGAAWA